MKHNRRAFIKRTAAASTGAFFTSVSQSWAQSLPAVPAAPGFELLFMATDWGFKGNREALCAAAKKEGYDGIEVWWSDDAKAQDELFNALHKHGMKVGFLCGGWQSDYKEHLNVFVRHTEQAAGNTKQTPLYINCHSGRDHFTVEQNSAFIKHTDQLNRQSGVPIYHETHRGRILFAAHISRQYMKQFPSLRITLDISHWCNVHESLLADQPDAVALALERTDHIHSRVGHAEGPQVGDPRAPEWEPALNAHLGWWDTVVATKKKKGERMTILTEFGPVDYMPALPYTRQAVADQWAINVHMMQMLRRRYQ